MEVNNQEKNLEEISMNMEKFSMCEGVKDSFKIFIVNDEINIILYTILNITATYNNTVFIETPCHKIALKNYNGVIIMEFFKNNEMKSIIIKYNNYELKYTRDMVNIKMKYIENYYD